MVPSTKIGSLHGSEYPRSRYNVDGKAWVNESQSDNEVYNGFGAGANKCIVLNQTFKGFFYSYS